MVYNRNEGQDDYPQRGYPPPRRPVSPIWGRLIIAALIAFVGWIMYISKVEENPVTGERQHVAISPDQEILLGLESAPQMSRQMGGEVSSYDPRAQEVQRVGNYIVEHSIAKKSPWKFQFHLLADRNTINAFALPGGQIFITLGLYNELENEAELAGVLGHEVGHVIERHTAEQMAKNQLGKTLVIAVGSTASGQFDPTQIASMVNQMIQLRYGRKDETEADTWGIKLMSEAGYDPSVMVEVMEVLKKASGGGGPVPEIFQSHPNPDLRIEQIKAYLKEHPPKEGLSKGKKLGHQSY